VAEQRVFMCELCSSIRALMLAQVLLAIQTHSAAPLQNDNNAQGNNNIRMVLIHLMKKLG
jgi:hypothetical protein